MESHRIYGSTPYRLAVIHGGPGAVGEMKPVAEVLSQTIGVIEPIQSSKTIQGLLAEMRFTLENQVNIPVTLIGFSWGAWLSYIFAASYPQLVEKLILIGSGPFEAKYVPHIMETRLSRLGENDKYKLSELQKGLSESIGKEQKSILLEFGKLMTKADSFNPTLDDDEEIDVNPDIYQTIWKEASELRLNGELLKFGKKIKCPVVAIHGDYDPHPYKGVVEPLLTVIPNFRFKLLTNCGHFPWKEQNAAEEFYRCLLEEVTYSL